MKSLCRLLLIFSILITHNVSAVPPDDVTDQLLQKGVIVRIWSSQLAGGEGVGHVSLRTRHNYISFWPQDQTEVASGHFNTIDEDYTDEEGRDPEITVFLPNPAQESPNLIREDFAFLQKLLAQGNLTWALNGRGQKLKRAFTREEYESQVQSAYAFKEDSHIFGVYSNWSFNCSSLVYNLLRNRGYLTPDTLSTVFGSNTFMAPDQVAQACSLSSLRQLIGPNYRQKCEAELRTKGIDGLMSFQERYVGYYIFKTTDRKVVVNQKCLDDAAHRIRQINEKGFFVQLAEGLISLGLSEAIGDGFNSGSK